MKTYFFALLFILSFLFNSKAQTGWTQKADCGGQKKYRAAGFSIGNYGYVGTGTDWHYGTSDFWKWNALTNTWTQAANFPGGARYDALAFSIGNRGYLGGGTNRTIGYNDFWEYDPATNTWTQKANISVGPVAAAVVFVIADKGYVVAGNYLLEYDPSTNTWTQKANFPGIARSFGAGFSIGNKGYLVGGQTNNELKDFWQWNQTTNTWAQKPDFGPGVRRGLVAFTIGNKAYAGTGNNMQDFWEWDETRNSWVEVESFEGVGREFAVAFTIGEKGYVCTGGHYLNTSYYEKDLWEYQPCVALASASQTICVGQSATLIAEGPTNYSWSTGATSSSIVVSPTISSIYTVSAVGINNCLKSVSVSVTVNTTPTINVSSSDSVICSGKSSTLSVSGPANTYLWFNGSQLSSIVVSPAISETYMVQGISAGCPVDSKTISITVLPTPTITASSSASQIYCGSSATLNASGADNYLWNNGATGSSIVVWPLVSTTYTVTGTSLNGCYRSGWAHVDVFLCTNFNFNSTETEKISVYPNPIAETLNVEIKNINKTASCVLTNIFGQTLISENINGEQLQLNLAHLESGIYFLEIKNGREQKTFKILKE